VVLALWMAETSSPPC